MTIPILHEDAETVAEFSGIIEQCHFCSMPTRYWHENTNNPVCPVCSKTHHVSELPDWGKAIRALKLKNVNGLKQSDPSEPFIPSELSELRGVIEALTGALSYEWNGDFRNEIEDLDVAWARYKLTLVEDMEQEGSNDDADLH